MHLIFLLDRLEEKRDRPRRYSSPRKAFSRSREANMSSRLRRSIRFRISASRGRIPEQTAGLIN